MSRFEVRSARAPSAAEEAAAERAGRVAAPQAPAAAQILALQSGAGNHAVARLLARQPAPAAAEQAGAAALPRPGEQPAHREAFDALTAALCSSDAVADLRAARAAVDGAGFSGERTVTYKGRSLVVDQVNVSELLRRVRWRAMEVVAKEREKGAAAVAAAADEPARRAATDALRTRTAELFKFLRTDPIADPRANMDRLEHWHADVQNAVHAVLGLIAVASAEGEMTGQFGSDGKSPSASKQESYDRAKLPKGEPWCGSFADMAQMRAGLAEFLKAYTQGTGGYAGLFSYASTGSWVPHWAWDGAGWVTVAELHKRRNSPRTWKVLGAGTNMLNLPIQPGDIVLLDNADGDPTKDFGPDHVQMVQSYRPAGGKAMLYTIGGNEDSFVLDDAKRVPTTPMEQQAGKPLKETKTDFSHVGIGERDLTKDAADAAGKGKGGHNAARVFAIGRFSIVDFEEHFYVASPQKPSKPPI